jgi:PST family polysaccharide transporter
VAIDEAAFQAQTRSSYREILRSSALIGGASVITLAITLLRTKAIATLLGPAGYGLVGIYGAVIDLVRGIAGMGVNSSGVRQIAASAGSDDPRRVACTVAVLRRTAVALALAGGVAMLALAQPIARLTFGSVQHAGSLRLLGLCVVLRLFADGQEALVQGCRRLGDLARINILGAALGCVAAVPAVWWLGERGVVPALVAIAAASAWTAHRYGRRVVVAAPAFAPGEVREELDGLLRTGLAFMASAMMTLGTAYATRLVVLRHDGIAAAGLYQAAWTVGGVYVGFVLQAMGADFYPRLVAAARSDDACNRLVNEQTQVGLLVALPGILATLSLAPLVVVATYSGAYLGAVELLRWVCAGMALRILSWPMGFIVVAKGRRAVYFFCELAWTIVSLLLAWSCVEAFGLRGAGIAFFLSYVFHAVMLVPVARALSGFRWSAANRRLAAAGGAAIAVLAGLLAALPAWAAAAGGLALTLVAGLHAVARLAHLVPPANAPRALRAACAASAALERVARRCVRRRAGAREADGVAPPGARTAVRSTEVAS